ncbi:hypothetical protein B14911_00465 [Bacillus sp. NRRL B-14911]|uniref:Uncharacterized protein n=1 Tax=Bacillus infantis NRRL B-14911 TaxID=1367477 RepID=U5L914_9BACI|nr:hypothetical protein N288_09835 [Bacillus infantis NRRL B-14911]EAR65697.1 hypothetical protein B14911_00465 [Bacillus sp. NRRL B-14911]
MHSYVYLLKRKPGVVFVNYIKIAFLLILQQLKFSDSGNISYISSVSSSRFFTGPKAEKNQPHSNG